MHFTARSVVHLLFLFVIFCCPEFMSMYRFLSSYRGNHTFSCSAVNMAVSLVTWWDFCIVFSHSLWRITVKVDKLGNETEFTKLCLFFATIQSRFCLTIFSQTQHEGRPNASWSFVDIIKVIVVCFFKDTLHIHMWLKEKMWCALVSCIYISHSNYSS